MNEREYDIMYAVEETHWWYVSLHELIAVTVAAEYAAHGPLKIFDAGCGTGRLGQLLRPYGEVCGCDLSPRAVGYSRTRQLEVCCADLNSMDFGVNRYDVITVIDVLYHQDIAAELPILRRLQQALKPGGVLILNLVAGEWLRSSHDQAVHTRRRYRLREVLQLLSDANLSTEKAAYRPAFLFPPIALYRLLRRWHDGLRPPKAVQSDLRLPNPLLNRLLLTLARLENRILAMASPPFGTSIFAVARRPIESEGGVA